MFAGESGTDCLARRRLPFIKGRHHISIIIFWPNMADIYYENGVGVVKE